GSRRVRALIVNENGEQRGVGAAELEHLTAQAAAGLAGAGVGVGDVVLVRLGKQLEWLVAMRALWRLGAVSLPCPELLTDGDLADRNARSGAVRELLAPDDVPMADGTPPAPELDDDAPAFLLFTSGTEGGP